jgi:hypothetical protein
MDHAARFTTFQQHVEGALERALRSMTTVDRVHFDAPPGAAAHVDEDLAQQAMLAIVRNAHPARRSVGQILREVVGSATGFTERDRINSGIRELVGAGLVHRHGQFVFASRAALRFDELRV